MLLFTFLFFTVLLDDTIGIVKAQFACLREVCNGLWFFLCTQIDNASVVIGLRNVSIQLDGTGEIIDGALVILALGVQAAPIIK